LTFVTRQTKLAESENPDSRQTIRVVFTVFFRFTPGASGLGNRTAHLKGGVLMVQTRSIVTWCNNCWLQLLILFLLVAFYLWKF
jgi:hypothetical protein